MRKKTEQVLIDHRKIAKLLGVHTTTVRGWIEKGVFPLPRVCIERLIFYPLDAVNMFIETGRWPEGTKFRRYPFQRRA